MMHSSLTSVVALALLFVAQGAAGPIHARQVGNLDCNLARVRIIGALASTADTVKQLPLDLNTAQALAGVGIAQAGIEQIVVALFNNQTAPPAARDLVGSGLTDARTALASVNVTAGGADECGLQKAQASLEAAIDAGNDVVTLCK
ncbi:hypothetical protein EXIGLDRAFT_762659 [Exidia glandulosa HHB12029]|uniref:Uncharacterized protein n=1 Tax=Exidia glandulosa HHB12029 TaxID=1314781 RepID=A0A165MJJ2_EXIGL|nr:hypothetical protein EXIGLDRAFT_762659 [Exidia glandulosa HHB12029]